MNIIEFIDLYDVEPVMARLRLHELKFSFADHLDLNFNDWSRFKRFSAELDPTWMGLLSAHDEILLIDVNLKALTFDAWDEILRINPKMFRHFLRIHPEVARSRVIDHRSKR